MLASRPHRAGEPRGSRETDGQDLKEAAPMYRMGNVPRRGDESELFQHAWTRKGFFGPYANLYKTRNPGEPIRCDPRLGPCSIDPAETRPTDLDQADGTPMPLLTNGNNTVPGSRRRAPN